MIVELNYIGKIDLIVVAGTLGLSRFFAHAEL